MIDGAASVSFGCSTVGSARPATSDSMPTTRTVGSSPSSPSSPAPGPAAAAADWYALVLELSPDCADARAAIAAAALDAGDHATVVTETSRVLKVSPGHLQVRMRVCVRARVCVCLRACVCARGSVCVCV
ncbi:MAG: hypothetical protein AAGD35_18915, partial [Actinomycetota bacterium]